MKLIISFLMPLFLIACGTTANKGGFYQDDGPGSVDADRLAGVNNAVPQAEPLSKQGNLPYTVFGRKYYPMKTSSNYSEKGVASWYGKKFHGRLTSSGEKYDMYAMTAAHRTLPLPSYVKVRNLKNGQEVIVRVNDRGPFLHNRLIDLSFAAAAKLGVTKTGTGLVAVTAIDPSTSVEELEPSQAAKNVSGEAADQGRTQVAKLEADIHTMYLQVGAFRDKANAQRLRQQLLGQTGKSVIISQEQVKDGIFYRVHVGPLATVEEGDKLTQWATQNGLPGAHIVVK